MDIEYFFSNPNYLSINCGSIGIFQDTSTFIAYKEINTVIYCPYHTSFAVIEGEMNTQSFQNFLDSKKNYSSKIEWILPPDIYPKSRGQFQFLHSFGFKIQSVELSQYINLEQDFSANLYPEKRRKLRRLQESVIETRILDVSFFDQCFDMIASNRSLKGYPLTMNKEDLKRLIISFPEQYLLIGTFIKNQLCACSITIKLSKTVLYQFYWAHLPEFDDKSPLVYHNYWLACQGKEWGMKIMDFGVSTDKGIINRGLFRFKQELGAIPTKKHYLTYTF